MKKNQCKNNLDLTGLILLAGATGDLDIEEAHSMLGILNNNEPILKTVPSDEDKVLGKCEIYRTLDITGQPLVSGENYIFRGQKVKVLKEQFGAGNIFDTYMRIYYLDTNLNNETTIVDASYKKGILNGPKYQSQFEPIKK